MNSTVYTYPEYYALGYRWNTDVECDFVQACLKAHGPANAKRLLDIGCGSGRHLLELARRGYHVNGIDISREMVSFARRRIDEESLPAKVAVGDLRDLKIDGTYDAAYCFMDTFRFLLTNEEIVEHLRRVGQVLVPSGLYLTDFWVPRQWETIGGEIHQWEQTEGDTTVRVFYLQHPETIDPIEQTFEDELVFEIHKPDGVEEIRGGRTRTRLILPQEFRSLVQNAGLFEWIGGFGAFDLNQPFGADSLSWRMISVLRRRVE